MKEEIFKDLKGFEGVYKISNTQRIIRIARKMTMKNGVCRNIIEREITNFRNNNMGYVMVDLRTIDGEKKTLLFHRLVAKTFIDNPNNYDQVDHIDGNKNNNSIENLEWVDQSTNSKRAYNNKLNTITDEAKERLSKNVTGISPKDRKKSVLQYDKEGNFINEYESLTEAGKSLNINRATIRDAINSRRGAKSAAGYIWKFKE